MLGTCAKARRFRDPAASVAAFFAQDNDFDGIV
jgi:hypothetical protein